VIGAQVNVAHRDLNRTMAGQLLYRHDIRSALDKSRAKRVPQVVPLKVNQACAVPGRIPHCSVEVLAVPMIGSGAIRENPLLSLSLLLVLWHPFPR